MLAVGTAVRVCCSCQMDGVGVVAGPHDKGMGMVYEIHAASLAQANIWSLVSIVAYFFLLLSAKSMIIVTSNRHFL